MTTVVQMPNAQADEVPIGPCRLLVRESALIYRETSVRLEPKVARVLRLLAERRGQVVSRQELIDQVWAGRPVTDDAVTRCISLLRKALDRELDAPVAIETLAKSGYRLKVLAVAPPAGPAGYRRVWAAALGLAAAVALVVLWPPGAATVAGYERKVLAVSEQWERYPSFSPDGRLLTYASGRSGAMAIYIRQLGGRGLQRLTAGDRHDHQPAFSPDQSQIAFARTAAGGGCEIRLVPAIGGRETLVGTCAGRGVLDLVWSADASHLLLVSSGRPLEPARLQRFDLDTGLAQTVTLPMGRGIDDLAISRDGRRIAVSVQFELGVEDIFIGPAAGLGPWRRLTRDQTKVHGLAWAPDGESVLFTSNRLGPFQLWRVAVADSGPGPELISEGLVGADAVDVNPAGSIVLERWYERSAVVALRPGQAAETAIVRDKSVNWDGRPAAHGQSRVFLSDRSGSAELWLQAAGELFQLTHSNGPWVMAPRWSNDLVAYTVPVDGEFGVRVYDVRRQREVRAYANGFAPFWSADGEHLYFGSRRRGQWQIWRKHLPTGEEQQMTQTGAKVGQLSPDEQALYFTKAAVPGIWKIDLADPAGEVVVVETLALVDWNNWQVSEEGIYYVQRVAGQAPRLRLFNSGSVKDIAELPDLLHFSGIWVGAGGAEIWYAKITEQDADIELLQKRPVL